MHGVINPMLGVSTEIIQIGLHDMLDVVESITHRKLKCGLCVLSTEWSFLQAKVPQEQINEVLGWSIERMLI